MAGGIIGFGFGFGVPTLFHYRSATSHSPLARMFVSPMVGAGHLGLVASGSL
jgi:hypothetical protein